MSIKEFFEEYKVWITSISGFVGILITFFSRRRVVKSGIEKTDAEKEQLQFDLRVKKDKYNKEQSELQDEKIDILEAKLEKMEVQMQSSKKLYDDALVLIGELKSELTMWKTIRDK